MTSPTPRWALTHGYTGGHYSLYRMLFSAYLATHFAQLLPWAGELFSNQGVLPDGSVSPLLGLFPNVLALNDSPTMVLVLVGIGLALSIPFGLGYRDRLAALGLWYVWACLFGRNPLISNPSLPWIGWLLLAHLLVAPAPYGSWSARGRTDPSGGWKLDGRLFGLAWALMAISYTYSGATKLISPSWLDGTAFALLLENPLARPGIINGLLLSLPAAVMAVLTWSVLVIELLSAPLALFRRARPWLWTALVGLHLGLLFLVDFADLTLGMLVLHAFTFDPAWLRPKSGQAPDLVFYDGGCGLCHRSIRFLLSEDRAGTAFRFAPLASEAFESAVPADRRSGLPDSIVVVHPDGETLVRSEAALHCASRLGGAWRAAAVAGRLVPRTLRDLAYDGVAQVRRRLFARPAAACPILPPHLRERFDVPES